MRSLARLVLAGAALWGTALGCGEDTPLGDDLASPAQREASLAPTEGAPPAPAEERGEADPVPRMGAPAAIGDAPDQPVQAVPPDPEREARERAGDERP